jgi:uncharacterized protein
MTPQEREMLAELADKIAKTPAPAHDLEADEFIRTNIGNRPDALYILTQTALIQNLALQHAQQEIQELKQRFAEPATSQPHSNFLGADMIPGASHPVPAPAGSSPWSSPAPAPPAVPQSVPPAAERSSFLRSAAQTAAGVAAGAFAFEGIRALFGAGPHLGSVGGGSFLGGAPAGDTVINNYYDTPGATERDLSERDERNDRSSNDSNNAQTSAASDDADTSNDESDSDSDDASYEDAGYSDDTSYDDGGGSGGDDLV